MHLDELAAHYVAQGVGVIGSNLFLGGNAKLPDLKEPMGAGPFITLIETPGMMPLFVHNYNTPHVQRPTTQVTARGTNYFLVRERIKQAYLASFLWNTVLSGVVYMKLIPRQEPGDLGHDAVGRIMIGFNIEVEKQAS